MGGARPQGLNDTSIRHALGALFDSNPVAVPGVLLLCAAGLGVLAWSRSRGSVERGTRKRLALVLAGAYAVIGILTAALSVVMLVQRCPLFYETRWQEPGETLVLVRWGPIPDVTVEREDVVSLTEMSFPRRSLLGRERVTQYSLVTASDGTLWSAPLGDGRRQESIRETLLDLNDRKMFRFLVNPGRTER